MSTVSRYRRRVREAEMEATISQAVARLNGRAFHVRDSRGLNIEDMPDLLLILPPRAGQPGRVALIEVKSQRRDVTAGQRLVLDLLEDCTEVLSGIVRPEPRDGEMSLDECLDLLTGGMTR